MRRPPTTVGGRFFASPCVLFINLSPCALFINLPAAVDEV